MNRKEGIRYENVSWFVVLVFNVLSASCVKGLVPNVGMFIDGALKKLLGHEVFCRNASLLGEIEIK